MPNIKSAIKRMHQSERRRMENRAAMNRMRTEIKKFRKLLEEEKFDDAKTRLEAVYSIIDRTSKRGVIHDRTAARYKSRLTRALTTRATAK